MSSLTEPEGLGGTAAGGAMERYREMKTRYETARAAMITEASTAFKEASVALFAQHPQLRAFSWRQFTPYFNDGDECVFRTESDYPEVDFEGEDDYDRYDLDDSDADTPATRAARDVSEFLQVFDDEMFKDMFGNHVEVLVSREGGVEVSDYTHHD